MMRLVIMGVATFLLSLGGTTGAVVMRGRTGAKVSADSTTQKDSTTAPAAKPTGPADTASPSKPEHPDSGLVKAVPSAGPADSVTAALTGTTSVAARPLPDVGRANPSYRQLARIFSNMKTTDASKILAFMSDVEVQGVIEQLGVRQAASLLAALPKERSAVLSRRLLHAGADSAAAK